VQIYNTALTSVQITKLQTLLSTQIAGNTALTTDDFSGSIDNFAYFNQALLPTQIRGLAVTGTAGTELATTNNLIDFYAGEGNALDTAGTNSGMIVGNVSYAAGVVGQAFDFDSANGYVALGTGPDIVGTGAFTVAVWVNTTSSGTEYIINQRDPSNANGEYVLQLNNGQVNFWTNANNTYGFNITTSEAVNDGKWHLIVAERLANGTGAIIIDGVLAAEQTVAPGSATNLESGINVYIGEDVRDAVDAGSAYEFNYSGLLEGVQIYNTALTPTQIANLQTSLATQITATSDERGDLRRVSGGLDIGADEYQYNLVITGSAPVSVPSNNLVTYSLMVTNDGPDPVSGATLTDVPPPYVLFLIASPPGWTVSDPAGGSITLTDSSILPSGGSAQFTLTGSVESGALNNAYIYNSVTVGPSTEDANAASTNLTFTTDVPNGLGLVAQPTTSTAGQPISPIVLNVVDNNNNTVTTDSTQLVTLSIASGPVGATLSGPTTVHTVNGMATFTGLSVNLPGSYVFVATGGDLTPIDTAPIVVAPAQVTIGTSPPPVVVTSGISIRREPLLRIKQTKHSRTRAESVKEKITIKNTSRHALSGPLALQVNGLLAGDTLSNASGTDNGVPYIDILTSGKSQAKNHSLTVTLDFSIDGKAPRNLQSIYKNIEVMLGL
jgi:uncharacterized repeat protein (TIGR01451 family)